VDAASILASSPSGSSPKASPVDSPKGMSGPGGCCFCFWQYMHTFILWVYFRNIVSEGESNIPEDGPIIVAANHSNGALDGILLFVKFTRSLQFVAKEALLKMPIFGACVTGVGTIPVLRPVDAKDPANAGNSISSMFDSVVDALREGSAICIFPEGLSHDGTKMITDKHSGLLKWGIGEMVMQALCQDVPAKIIPCGVHYDDKTNIRSSAYISYGRPIEISAAAVAEYKQWQVDNPDGHVRDNTATLKLLSVIQEGIEKVWLHAPTSVIRNKAELAYEVWSGKLADKEQAKHPEKFYHAVQYYVNLQVTGTDVLALELLNEYHAELETWGAGHQDVVAQNINFGRMIFGSVAYLILLILSLPLLLPGAIMILPIRISASLIASHVASGIAKGDIKKGVQPEDYRADDVIGTIKIMVSMVLSVLFFPAYAAVGCVLLDDTFGIPKVAWYFICLIGGIIVTIISIPFLDLATYAIRKISMICKACCCCGPAKMDILMEKRDNLLQALTDERSNELKTSALASCVEASDSTPKQAGFGIPDYDD